MNDKYLKILNRFCAKDDFRLDWIKNINNAYDKTVATNGIILVAVPKISDEYKDVTEKISHIYPMQSNINIKYLINKIEEQAKTYWPVVIKCKACEGSGEVEFSFDYDYQIHTLTGTCPVCDGSGENKENKTYYRFQETVVSLEQINGLYYIAKSVGVKEITLVYSSAGSPCGVFQIGELDVVTAGRKIVKDGDTIIEVIGANLGDLQ